MTVVSSANLRSFTDESTEDRSFVYREKRSGDRTQALNGTQVQEIEKELRTLKGEKMDSRKRSKIWTHFKHLGYQEFSLPSSYTRDGTETVHCCNICPLRENLL
ncbi:hypothetical protein ILYODFUR_036442 [Ilyodon furcidens]|uniref:Uncharacterized protein n=1 Tax=Ilyodon furcidens TaxID=33524 RepID=A0ABV0T5H5_9TELE